MVVEIRDTTTAAIQETTTAARQESGALTKVLVGFVRETTQLLVEFIHV
jgi:hypothetical protein